MRKENPNSIAYAMIIWISLLLLVAKDLYDNCTNENRKGGLASELKTMKDMVDGHR